jgi:hypothetical protein
LQEDALESRINFSPASFSLPCGTGANPKFMRKTFKSLLAKPFAAFISARIKKEMHRQVEDQRAILEMLIRTGKKTEFGKEHHFTDIAGYEQFRQAVPLKDYEQLLPYIERIKEGKHNVLWKGLPIYLAKTSGTTSGIKYIPITKDSIDNHIDTARNALLCYIAETGNNRFTDGKMIFLSGSPELERIGGIPTGRLSGIVNHHVPGYLRANQFPSFETNCIENWEVKLDRIVAETIAQDMTLISGIPPWVQMYLDRLREASGKKIGDLFPNLDLLVHGGVNFEPYKAQLLETIGRPVDLIETYPASEGFIAFQDTRDQEGLLLNTNSGIFFEFMPVDRNATDVQIRLPLSEVKPGIQYAVVISSNAGLWGYDLGDTIKFLSVDPYRLVVTGRTKHFISAFGEHVIAEEAEECLIEAANRQQVKITEFTVAPLILREGKQSCHEWFIEFDVAPADPESFALEIDQLMRKRNVYYDDLVRGNILGHLKIRQVQKKGFINYMKTQGKLGGQNKMPRLSNNRLIADALMNYVIL